MQGTSKSARAMIVGMCRLWLFQLTLIAVLVGGLAAPASGKHLRLGAQVMGVRSSLTLQPWIERDDVLLQ